MPARRCRARHQGAPLLQSVHSVQLQLGRSKGLAVTLVTCGEGKLSIKTKRNSRNPQPQAADLGTCFSDGFGSAREPLVSVLSEVLPNLCDS